MLLLRWELSCCRRVRGLLSLVLLLPTIVPCASLTLAVASLTWRWYVVPLTALIAVLRRMALLVVLARLLLRVCWLRVTTTIRIT